MDRVDFSPTSLDLNEIIQAQAIFFKATAITKNNQLNTSITPDLKVLADEDYLNFILRNLIANAMKFTQNGKILLSATLKGQLVEISIKDTGRGVDTSLMDKIFSVAHKSTTLGTAGEKGTGLGLPLCKEFIEKNGGTIWVESAVGKGSTFFFTLKVA
jgi:signal transduction histidine kinase